MESQESATDATSSFSGSAISSTATPEPIESPPTAPTSDADALVAACERGDLDAVASVLDAGVHPDALNADCMTPLCRATEGGHLQIVRLLLERGATVDLVDHEGDSALLNAASYNYVEIAQELLTRGAAIDLLNANNFTALCYAATIVDSVDAVQLLLARGADPNIPDDQGNTPLLVASERGHFATVAALLDEGADYCCVDNEGQSALFIASMNGHLDVVKILLDRGADIEQATLSGATPLFTAAGNGCLDVVNLLLDRGAIAAAADSTGTTPLYMASMNDCAEIVRELLNRGVDVNCVDHDGDSSLYVASSEGRADVVTTLLNTGAKIELTTVTGETALHAASSAGHLEVVTMLLDHEANVSASTSTGCTPLHCATEEGHADVVQLLMARGAPLDLQKSLGITALYIAAECNHVEVARLLVKQGADVNLPSSNDWTPLNIASLNESTEVVTLLVASNADLEVVNCDGDTALLCAASGGYIDIANALVTSGAAVNFVNPQHGSSALLFAANADGDTALYAASANGHLDVVALLLDRSAASSTGYLEVITELLNRGANVNAQNSSMCTPVFVASMNGHIDVVLELLDRNADANIADEDSDSPLGMAARNGHIDVAKLLLDRGTSADLANSKGETPLHLASMRGHVDVVQLLLDSNAPVNAVDIDGETPLHIASIKDHQDVVLLLLDRNADADLQNAEGVTAMHHAGQNGHLDIATLLLNRGAAVDMVDVNGDSPLTCSSREGHADIVDLLIARGASLKTRNTNLETPLLAAARFGHFDVVQALRQAGSGVDVQASSGETLLIYAARWSQLDFTSVLLEGDCLSFTKLTGTETPLLSSSLQKASQYASEMHEFHDLWQHVMARLNDIFDKVKHEEAASQGITRQFVMILTRLIKLKTTCENTNVITRLVFGRKIVSSIQDFHAEIDFLQRRVERTWSDSMHSEWRSTFAGAQSNLLEIFDRKTSDEDTLASDLEAEVDRVEALALLQYETMEHCDKYSENQLLLLQCCLERVTRLCADESRSVAEWFLPPHEIEARSGNPGISEGEQSYRAKWQSTNVIVSEFEMSRDEFVANCDTWFQLSHPNVAKLFGASHFRSPLQAVFENASATSLLDYLASDENRRAVWQKLYEVALGINYLHQRTIVLGKIQCADIWIGTDHLAKIAAFGKYSGEAQSADDSKTVRWKSPEVLHGETPTTESDVFSFGSCIFEALSGSAPWAELDDGNAQYNVKLGNLPLLPDSMSRAQQDLVREMLSFQPSKRTRMLAVIEHLKQFAVEEQQDATDPAVRSSQASPSVDLHEFVVPELGATVERFLEKLRMKCALVVESQGFVQHVHARLANIYAYLEQLQKLPRDIEVIKFCEVLISFDSFLRIAVSATSVVQRAKSRKVSLKSNILHREVDGVLNMLNIEDIDPIHTWTKETDATIPELSSEADEATLNTAEEDQIKQQSGSGSGSGAIKFLHFEASNTNRKFDAINTSSTTADDTTEPFSAPWSIPIYELKYTQDDYIGMGAFGAVYRGAWLNTPVVVKFMGYEDDSDPDAEEMFLHELRVWFPLTHPHVVKLYGACHLGKRFFVCEYAANGTLRDFLQGDEALSKTWKKLYEVALGLQYLHEQNIVHNDMKCDNFLVGGDGKAKITDFGLSCIANSAEVKIDPKQQGAQQWKAPEYLRGERSTFASDIYSFGMCILEAVTGKTPWGSVADVFVRAKVRKGFLPPRPTSLNDDQWSLIEMMCASEPLCRLSISSVVEQLREFSKQVSRRSSAKCIEFSADVEGEP
ncbi:Tkl protein kinase [Globisporangium polare]